MDAYTLFSTLESNLHENLRGAAYYAENDPAIEKEKSSC